MGLLGKIIGTALDIVEIPIAIVKDVATLDGMLTDKEEPYTKRKISELAEDYKGLKKALKKD